jgi:8-amino-7-oxononanoate synthase
MADFTSALYLGLNHPSRALTPWKGLSTGKPVVLEAPERERPVAHALARLQGSETALLGPSTLHLFWDLLGILADDRVAILIDRGTYPIARWGAERLVAKGVPIQAFRHKDPDHLARCVQRWRHTHRLPLVIADGLCPACGQPAPLHDFLAIVEQDGGWLVVDDTQALGILGHSPDELRPFGLGGGGTPRWHGVSNPRLLTVSSLAKGFGTPIATLSGSRAVLNRFERASQIRIHCSPPSAAVIAAAARALAVNAQLGEVLRQRLLRNIRKLRTGLQGLGLQLGGGWFPVQTLLPAAGIDFTRLHQRLRAEGIDTLLHSPRSSASARLGFALTARHRPDEIELAVEAVAANIGRRRRSENILETNHAYLL